MISILFALTISTSSMGASVGAIKAYPGAFAFAEPPANLKNAVDNLNNTLTLSTDTIKTSIENIRELSKNNQDNEEISIKLGIILSQLDDVINSIHRWNDFSIENLELVNQIQQNITKLNLNTLLDETKDINKLDSLEQNSNKIFNEIEKVNQKLTKENQQLFHRGQIFEFAHNNNDDNDNNNNEPQKNEEELDANLTKEINEIKDSNEPANQKIEKIVNILENKKFNNYKRQLDVILPIIDSLYIAGEKDSHYITGEKKVNNVLEKVNNHEINNNKQLRSKLRKFVSQCIIQYIDDEINVYRTNDMTKPLSEYIDLQKNIISDASINVVITSTFHKKYTKSGQLFDVVNKQLSQYERQFLDTHQDKNLVKNINKLQLSSFLDNLVEKNREISKETINNQMSMSRQLLDSFDTMFRQYAQRITGMKTNLEMDAGYGENQGEDIPDDALINFQEAVNKWGIDNLEKHYIRDKVVKDNLNDTLQKYKSLKDLYDKVYAPLNDLADIAAGLGTEEDLKKSIDQAKQALDDFQNRVVVIDNNEFVVIED